MMFGFSPFKRYDYKPVPTRWPWPPSKCPVCGGNGLVPNGFYGQTAGQWVSTSTVPEKCRSCDGKGIV